MSRTHYKHGQWNAICDVCGFKFKSTDLRKRWDGLMCCEYDWEPRHPSDFFRGKPDNQSVPWNRTDSSSTENIGTLTAEITVTTAEDTQVFTIEVMGVPGIAPTLNPSTATSVPSGTFNGNL